MLTIIVASNGNNVYYFNHISHDLFHGGTFYIS